jgi:hypothetical protein
MKNLSTITQFIAKVKRNIHNYKGSREMESNMEGEGREDRRTDERSKTEKRMRGVRGRN